MTKAEIRTEIKKALKRGFICVDCCFGKTHYPIIFAEPQNDGYIDWFFDPDHTNICGGYWLEGFKTFEEVPTGISYKEICYRLSLDNPIKYFIKEMLVKGKTLFSKKEGYPLTKIEWDEDDIF